MPQLLHSPGILWHSQTLLHRMRIWHAMNPACPDAGRVCAPISARGHASRSTSRQAPEVRHRLAQPVRAGKVRKENPERRLAPHAPDLSGTLSEARHTPVANALWVAPSGATFGSFKNFELQPLRKKPPPFLVSSLPRESRAPGLLALWHAR